MPISPRIQVAVATAVGALLRGLSVRENLDFPHGDVHLDAATARSLAAGRGFWTPWEEGTSLLPDPIGTTLDTFGHPADQHGPLWPLICAPLVRLLDDSVLALQLMSWLAGVLTIVVGARVMGRFHPKAGVVAAWSLALCLPLCDYSGNGSLYAAQVLGVLALPLVARNLERARDALAAGALLGALFLLNYQCVVLLPAYAAALVGALGFSAAIRPLLISAAACLAVTLPWFARNAIVLGNPLFTTNLDYVKYFLNLHRIDVEAARPMILDDSAPGDIVRGMLSWAPKNTIWFLTVIHLAVAVLPLLAVGGFGRLAQRDAQGRRAVGGWLLVAAFFALLLAAGIWPQPKSRYVVPLVALIACASSLELAIGARFLPAAAAALATALFGLYLNAPTDPGFPWKEARLLVPTLAIPALFLLPAARRWMPALCVTLMAFHGAFRAYISIDKPWGAEHVFGVKVEGASMFGPPGATFYDVIAAPVKEGYEKVQLYDLKRAAASLRDAGVQRVCAPVEIALFWRGGLVSTPWYMNQFPRELYSRIREVFGVDGLVIGYGTFNSADMKLWLGVSRAETVYTGSDYMAVRWR